MIDWGLVGVVVAAAIPSLGVAVAMGVLRQKVADLRDQVNGESQRIDKLEAGLRAAEDAKHGVDLVQSEQRSFRTETGLRFEAVLSEVKHLGELWNARLETAIAEGRRSPRPSSRSKPG